MSDLYRKSATECVELLQRREVSSTELVQASLQRIESVNPHINALPCLLSDRALTCLLYTSPSPRDGLLSRMPSSA